MAAKSELPEGHRDHKEEKTFRSFSKEQGDKYAENRLAYHPELHKLIVDHHQATGGQLGTVLDVGCGPGQALRGSAPYFDHAIGIDPSDGMIAAARSAQTGGDDTTTTRSGSPMRFEQSTAEHLGADLETNPVVEESVDLITAAAAAHWFDMPRFWGRAAKVLRPGGTVALWTSSTARVKPDTTPNAAAVQAVIDRYHKMLEPYMLPGNLLSHRLYVDLPLPWNLTDGGDADGGGSGGGQQQPPSSEFDEVGFVRREWNTEGCPESCDKFYREMRPVNMQMMEAFYGTISPVVRWRDEHPDDVGTERDIVRMLRREVEQALQAGGVEEGKELLEANASSVLLMVKKKR